MTTEATTYNGWTNYETWNVALWMGEDGNYWAEIAQEVYDSAEADGTFSRDERAALDLADVLQERHDEMEAELTEGKIGTLIDLLRASLSEVNWHEIAEHYIEDCDKDEEEAEESDE